MGELLKRDLATMPSAGLQPPPSGSAPSAPSVAPAGSSASAPSAGLQPPPSVAEQVRRQIVEDVKAQESQSQMSVTSASSQTWIKQGWDQWYDNHDYWTDDK